MPDATLHIVTTTDDAGIRVTIARLQELDSKIRAGTASIAEQAEFIKKGTALWSSFDGETRKLNQDFAATIATTKNLKEQGIDPLTGATGRLHKTYFEAGTQLREYNRTMLFGGLAADEMGAKEDTLANKIRSGRQERRMGMFAVRESTAAVGSLIGGESALAKTMTDGASAAFGMKFALDMMGGSAIKIALPFAIFIGLATVIKDLLKGSKDDTEKAAEATKKHAEQVEQLAEKIRKLSNELDNAFPGGKRTLEIIVDMKKSINDQLKEIDEQIKAEKEKSGGALTLFGQDTELGRLTKLRESTRQYFEYQEGKLREHAKLVREFVQLSQSVNMDQMRKVLAAGFTSEELAALTKGLTDQLAITKAGTEIWFRYTKALELVQKAVKQLSETREQLAERMQKDIHVSAPGESLTPSQILGGRGNIWGMGKPQLQHGWLGEEGVFHPQFEKGKNDAEMLGETMKNSFTQATTTLADELRKTFGLANNLVGNFFATILSGLTQFAAAKAGSGLWDILSGIFNIGTAIATGGVSLAPTALFGAAKTITAHASGDYWFTNPTIAMDTRTKQFHMIADQGPEHLANMNQMAQASRYGGGQKPVFIINNTFDEGGIATVVERGNITNSRRRVGGGK
jgi:hypothetical protein